MKLISLHSRRNIFLGLAALALLFTSGCALQTGTITREPIAQFALTGNAKGVTVLIDDFTVPLQKTPFQTVATKPGKHRIRIMRDGQVVVDREVMLTDEQTFEIILP